MPISVQYIPGKNHTLRSHCVKLAFDDNRPSSEAIDILFMGAVVTNMSICYTGLVEFELNFDLLAHAVAY